MGCLKHAISFAENPFHLIPSSIAPLVNQVGRVALNFIPGVGPALSAAATAADSYAHAPSGQGLGAGLKSGALSYAGSQLGSALGGGGSGVTSGGGVGGVGGSASGGGSSFLGDVGNGISDAYHAVTGGLNSAANGIGDFTGLTDVANGIGDAAKSAGSSFGSAANDVGNATGLTDVANGVSDAYHSVGSGLRDVANGVGNYIGVGTPAGSPISATVAGPTQGTGILGAAGRGISSLNNSIGGTTGGSVGTNSNTPSFGGQLATLAGGLGQGLFTNQAQQDQLKQIKAQQANLGTFNPAGITSDPGYQFQYDQGLQGLQRQLAAGGGTQSGGALKAATQYGQNYANNAFNDYYNRWANQTGAQNQLLANKGNVEGNTDLAQGQNISQSLTNAFNPQTPGLSDILKRLAIG